MLIGKKKNSVEVQQYCKVIVEKNRKWKEAILSF
jgi:hypothetical protein